MNVVIIDYGMSNLGSIKRALEESGATVSISDDPARLDSATHIVLPGVGAFKDGIKNLQKKNFHSKLRKIVLHDKIPLLGICLGMQLLAEEGHEGGKTKGLCFIPGSVNLLKPLNLSERIPHVGWNDVQIKRSNSLFAEIPDNTDFYFVHSYHFVPTDKKDIIGTTRYCGSFVSSVMRNNIFGVQFHPEKSQYWGFQILKNFLKFNATYKC